MRAGGYGLIGDIVVGVLGALIGGYLASHLFHIKKAVTGINLETILVALWVGTATRRTAPVRWW